MISSRPRMLANSTPLHTHKQTFTHTITHTVRIPFRTGKTNLHTYLHSECVVFVCMSCVCVYGEIFAATANRSTNSARWSPQGLARCVSRISSARSPRTYCCLSFHFSNMCEPHAFFSALTPFARCAYIGWIKGIFYYRGISCLVREGR